MNIINFNGFFLLYLQLLKLTHISIKVAAQAGIGRYESNYGKTE